MEKLKDLINESKYLKREFGDPLPTLKGVMEKHQVNKLKEDWWDDMDAKAQAQYIKDHPGSKQAQQADTGEEEPSGEPEKVQAAIDTVADLKDRHRGSKAQLIDKLETMKKSEVDGIQATISAERDRLKEKSTGEEDGILTFDNDEDAEAYWAAESAASDFYNMTHHYGDEVRYQPEDKEGGEQGRTGNELNQETLTINGKQYCRINEEGDAFDAPIPAQVKRYMGKFIGAVQGAKLNRKRTGAILGQVVNALGIEPNELMRYVRLVKKGL